LTDLTAKSIPNRVPWGNQEQRAFDALKAALTRATTERLAIINMQKPFQLLVDASDHTVSGVLTQVDDLGVERPIAFISQKLNETQRRWATVEKEAFAALTMLRKYSSGFLEPKLLWYQNHNPLTISRKRLQ